MPPPPPGFPHVTGDLDCSVVLVHLPVAQVSDWLAPPLQLASQDLAPVGHHPVLVVLANRLRCHFSGLPWPQFSWREAMLVVPWTRVAEGGQGGGVHPGSYAGPFWYVVDSLGSSGRLWGWRRTGLARATAPIEIQRGRWSAGGPGKPWAIDVHAHDIAQMPEHHTMRRIGALLQQPVLARGKGAKLVTFGLHWALGDAWLRELDVDGTVQTPAQRLTLRQKGTRDLGNGGAFRVGTRFTQTLVRPLGSDWSGWCAGPSLRNQAGALPAAG